jgi:5-methylcytosine-specific restriction endonuclease McrA
MDTSIVPLLKTCSKCGEEKPATLEFFPKIKWNKQGLASRCKLCQSIYRRDYYARHREDAVAYSAQYTKDHREEANAYSRDWGRRNADRRKRYNENWKKANRGKYLTRRRSLYQLHREERCEEAKEWRKRNPDLVRIHWKVKQARKRSNGGAHTSKDIKRIFTEQDHRCSYCGITLFWSIKGDIHVDHFHPLVRGGPNNPDNLRCTCENCNLSKGGKTYDEWVAWRGW